MDSKPWLVSLVLTTALALPEVAECSADQHAESLTTPRCEEPKKPIDKNRLRRLARQEIQRREKTPFTTFEVSWGANTCAWLVVASVENPGPGEDRIMMFSNEGKLVSYQGGM